MDHLCNFCLFLCFCARLFIDALWSFAGKGLTSWLSFVMSNCEGCYFPIGILGQVWCLIISIPDLYPLSYFFRGCKEIDSPKNDQNKVQSVMDRCYDQTAYEKTPETLPSCPKVT